MLWLRWKLHGALPGCIKWKEAKGAFAKQAPEQGRKSAATGHPVAPKVQRDGTSAGQMDLGEWWGHVARWGRFKASDNRPQNPNPSPQPVTELPKQPKVTATMKTARPKKPQPIPAAAPAKPKKKAVAIVETEAP